MPLYCAIGLLSAVLAPCAVAQLPAVSVDACRKDLLSEDAGARHAAVLRLGWLGPDAAPALSELKQAMHAPEDVVRHDVFNTLVRIGPKAVPVLAEALKDNSPEIRWRAVNALLRLGSDARLAVPSLADRVRNAPGFQMRILAALKLGQLGPLARDALPALTVAATDRANDGLTWHADQPSSVCEAAIGAVRKIDSQAWKAVADAALPTLREMLKNEGDAEQAAGERQAAARALALLGPHAAPALADLRDAVLRRAVDPAPFVEACVRGGAEGQTLLLETLLGPAVDRNLGRRILRSLAFTPGLGPDAIKNVTLMLKDPEGVIRCLAAMTLASQGPAAEPAIPSLIPLLADPALTQLHDGTLVYYDLNYVAAEALARIGPKAVPALLEALKNDATRYQAVIALGRMGSKTKDAIPALRELLDGPPTPVTVQAAGALIRIGDDPGGPMRKLVTALKEVELRGSTLEILASGRTRAMWGRLRAGLGPPRDARVPREAVPVLLELLADERHRAHAANVLGGMRHAADEIVPKVSALLRAGDRQSRSYLLGVFHHLGPAAKEAVPEILRCLEQDASEETRRAAFYALREIGPGAKEAVPVLLEALKASKTPGRSEVLWTLGHIGVGSEEVIDALVRVLRDRKDGRPGRAGERCAAAWALAKLGPAATPAVPALREALLDDDAIVRLNATTALVAAGNDGDAHFRLLMLSWRDAYDPEEAYPVLPHVLEAIELLGPKAAGAVPRLLELLDKPPADRFDPDHRAEALRALARIGPAAKAALPRLKELAASNEKLAAPAAEAIRAIEGESAAQQTREGRAIIPRCCQYTYPYAN